MNQLEHAIDVHDKLSVEFLTLALTGSVGTINLPEVNSLQAAGQEISTWFAYWHGRRQTVKDFKWNSCKLLYVDGETDDQVQEAEIPTGYLNQSRSQDLNSVIINGIRKWHEERNSSNDDLLTRVTIVIEDQAGDKAYLNIIVDFDWNDWDWTVPGGTTFTPTWKFQN